jgi:hypothetical protein
MRGRPGRANLSDTRRRRHIDSRRKITGEGDCTVRWQRWLLLCLLLTDEERQSWRHECARDDSNHGPADDKKYFNSSGASWRSRRSYQPGGGGATWAARWLTTRETLTVGKVPSGVGSFFSQVPINFTAFSEALLAIDGASWIGQEKRIDSLSELHDANTGPNQLSNKRNPAYMDIHRIRVSAGATSCFSRLRLPDNVSPARHS